MAIPAAYDPKMTVAAGAAAVQPVRRQVSGRLVSWVTGLPARESGLLTSGPPARD